MIGIIKKFFRNQDDSVLPEGLEHHFENIEAMFGRREPKKYKRELIAKWPYLSEEGKQEYLGVTDFY